MSPKIALAVLCMLTGAAASAMAQSPLDAAALLRQADGFRGPDLPSYASEITITPSRNDHAEDASSYTILSNSEAGAIVTAETADQAGQKFLATDHGFWFFAPRTHRAIRLTPMQLLRGQASIGDISRVSFSRDYDVAGAPAASKAQGAAWTLALQAKSGSSTYARIKLEVASDGHPVEGQLYSISGRLLKTVSFGPVTTVSGHPMIADTIYADGVDPGQHTLVHTVSIEVAAAPAGRFSPEALVTE